MMIKRLDWSMKGANKMLHIQTPYGDEYTIDDQFNISRYNQQKSRQWKIQGILNVRRNLWAMILIKSITKEWLESHPLTYKNGNPMYTIADLDYGTTRTWGNTKVHGIKYMWLD